MFAFSPLTFGVEVLCLTLPWGARCFWDVWGGFGRSGVRFEVCGCKRKSNMKTKRKNQDKEKET